MQSTLVAGAGGFIGGHIVRRLLALGDHVRAVDIKPVETWWQASPDSENVVADLTDWDSCASAVKGMNRVINLAADMGGIGFITKNSAVCMMSVLSSTHLLKAAHREVVGRYFFASSACVYPDFLQSSESAVGLRESDVLPASPEGGYGWEKLFGEQLCRTYGIDFGFPARVGRFHNVYGPFGSWVGGREKAPAAICRKVARAKLLGEDSIDIWGDGRQQRSFTYIDDCVEGTLRILESDCDKPLNVGSDIVVTIDQLVALVEQVAGVSLRRVYTSSEPQGVRSRNSDNTEIVRTLGWCPSTTLLDGLEVTYQWVFDQLSRSLDGGSGAVPSMMAP